MCSGFMLGLRLRVIGDLNRDLAMPLHVAEIDGERSMSDTLIPNGAERRRNGRPHDRDERDPVHEPIA